MSWSPSRSPSAAAAGLPVSVSAACMLHEGCMLLHAAPAEPRPGDGGMRKYGKYMAGRKICKNNSGKRDTGEN